MSAETIDKPAAPAATPTPSEAAKPAATPAPAADQGAKPAQPTKPAAEPAKSDAAAPRKSLTASVESDAGKGEGETSEKGEAAKPESVVPERYELIGPDGKPLDADTMKSVEALGRELGLSNEAAQKYLNHETQRMNAQWDSWQEQIKNHPTLGGENLSQSQRYAAKAAGLGNDKFRALIAGPYGDEPSVFEFLVSVGKHLSPDTHKGAGGPPAKARTTEEDELRAAYPTDTEAWRQK